jgi:hypothetical protein
MWHYPLLQPVRVRVLEAWKASSQVSNTVRLHAPSTVKGAIRFWLHSPAIMFTRPWRRPDLSAWKRCPLGFQPWSYWSRLSIPDSSR